MLMSSNITTAATEYQFQHQYAPTLWRHTHHSPADIA